ncbi:hypothetical protein BBJ28_00003883 [Nothophytophthora sp. Chile5]|nr:hypothetical protein BBJ28_00003883 [Nothophytophthora sp. Chile5]
MSSRVPLLMKAKGRKPSRLPIAPRAQPSNGASATATSPVNATSSTTEKPQQGPQASKAANTAAMPPVVKATLAQPAAVSTPAASAAVSSPSSVVTPAVTAQKTGGISIGGSLTSSSTSTVPTNGNAAKATPAVRSPAILPVQRRPERLAKITSAGPVYRASPVLGPRSSSSSSSTGATDRQGNPLKQRLLRKLDIKPHQSPRRAIQQQTLRQTNGPSSPLLLGGKAPPETDKDVADTQTDVLQSRRATTTTAALPKAPVVRKKRPTPVKRRKISEVTSVQTSGSPSAAVQPRRRSLGRKAKREQSYRDADGSSGSASEPDDDGDEDVDPNELELPEEHPTVRPRKLPASRLRLLSLTCMFSFVVQIYVPARERATLWAKSVLRQHEEGDGEVDGDSETSRALVVRERKAGRASAARRKRSNSTASSISSLVSGIGAGSGTTSSARSKMEELLKKEPSQMTMGELALTVPKGRRLKRHEREEAATAADTPLLAYSPRGGESSSNLLNPNALNRVRSLSVSSESAAFAGSLVTPQVQIVDGQMVVLENTIKLGDQLQHTADVLGGSVGGDDDMGMPPRHSGPRLNSSHPNGPGKRWGKEETKQFYYCLSQVGPNFSMMATLFPSRKRKELKSKFKYEEKNHSKLIEIALRASTAPLDTEMVSVISQMVDAEKRKKLDAEKRKRRARTPLEIALGGDVEGDDTASVASNSATAASPMAAALLTPLAQTEEFVETLDADLYLPERHSSFDFSG